MPRITFDVSKEVHEKLSLIPWGSRKRVLVMIVESLADMIAEDRVKTLSKVLQQTLTLDEMMGTNSDEQ